MIGTQLAKGTSTEEDKDEKSKWRHTPLSTTTRAQPTWARWVLDVVDGIDNDAGMLLISPPEWPSRLVLTSTKFRSWLSNPPPLLPPIQSRQDNQILRDNISTFNHRHQLERHAKSPQFTTGIVLQQLTIEHGKTAHPQRLPETLPRSSVHKSFNNNHQTMKVGNGWQTFFLCSQF